MKLTPCEILQILNKFRATGNTKTLMELDGFVVFDNKQQANLMRGKKAIPLSVDELRNFFGALPQKPIFFDNSVVANLLIQMENLAYINEQLKKKLQTIRENAE